MWNYLKFSNIKLSVDINPFVWGFKWMFQPPTQSDPNLRIQYVRFLFLSLVVVIDNGVYHIWEEEAIQPTETKADPL
jgi:hypothetical protein